MPLHKFSSDLKSREDDSESSISVISSSSSGCADKSSQEHHHSHQVDARNQISPNGPAGTKGSFAAMTSGAGGSASSSSSSVSSSTAASSSLSFNSSLSKVRLGESLSLGSSPPHHLHPPSASSNVDLIHSGSSSSRKANSSSQHQVASSHHNFPNGNNSNSGSYHHPHLSIQQSHLIQHQSSLITPAKNGPSSHPNTSQPGIINYPHRSIQNTNRNNIQDYQMLNNHGMSIHHHGMNHLESRNPFQGVDFFKSDSNSHQHHPQQQSAQQFPLALFYPPPAVVANPWFAHPLPTHDPFALYHLTSNHVPTTHPILNVCFDPRRLQQAYFTGTSCVASNNGSNYHVRRCNSDSGSFCSGYDSGSSLTSSCSMIGSSSWCCSSSESSSSSSPPLNNSISSETSTFYHSKDHPDDQQDSDEVEVKTTAGISSCCKLNDQKEQDGAEESNFFRVVNDEKDEEDSHRREFLKRTECRTPGTSRLGNQKQLNQPKQSITRKIALKPCSSPPNILETTHPNKIKGETQLISSSRYLNSLFSSSAGKSTNSTRSNADADQRRKTDENTAERKCSLFECKNLSLRPDEEDGGVDDDEMKKDANCMTSPGTEGASLQNISNQCLPRLIKPRRRRKKDKAKPAPASSSPLNNSSSASDNQTGSRKQQTCSKTSQSDPHHQHHHHQAMKRQPDDQAESKSLSPRNSPSESPRNANVNNKFQKHHQLLTASGSHNALISSVTGGCFKHGVPLTSTADSGPHAAHFLPYVMSMLPLTVAAPPPSVLTPPHSPNYYWNRLSESGTLSALLAFDAIHFLTDFLPIMSSSKKVSEAKELALS